MTVEWERRRVYMRALQELKDACNKEIDRAQEGRQLDDDVPLAVGDVLAKRSEYLRQ